MTQNPHNRMTSIIPPSPGEELKMKDICFCDMFQNFQTHFQAHTVCVTLFSFTSVINWYFSYTKWVSRNETPIWIIVLMRNEGPPYDGSLFVSSRNEAGNGGVHSIPFLTSELFFLLIPNAHKSCTKIVLLHRRHRYNSKHLQHSYLAVNPTSTMQINFTFRSPFSRRRYPLHKFKHPIPKAEL